jgi:predicted outer membrane repeat protein
VKRRPMNSRSRFLLTGASAGVVAMSSVITGYAGGVRAAPTYAAGMLRPAATSGCGSADTEVTTEGQFRAALAASTDESVICVTQSITVTSPLVIDDTSVTIIGRDDSAVVLDGGGATGILEAHFTGGSHELTISRLGFARGLRNADDSGAGLQVVGDGDDSLVITDSSFSGNIVSGNTNAGGGGLYAGNLAIARLTNVTLTGNRDMSSASSRVDPPGGGGMALVGTAVAYLTNITTSDNYTRMSGGAIATNEVPRLYVNGLNSTDDSAGTSFSEGGTLWADSFLSTDDTIMITGATVTGAYAPTGAAISVQNFNSYSLLSNSTFTGNTSEGDGAVYLEVYGRAVVKDTTFSANSLVGGGFRDVAGLLMTDSSQRGKGDFTVDNVDLFNHSVAAVSGSQVLFMRGGNISVLDSEITGNTTDNAAVEIRNYNNANSDGTLLIDRTTFHDNTADNKVAGLYIRSYGETGGPANPGDVTIRDSLFTANTASNADGGAALLRLGQSGGVTPRLVVEGSTFGSLTNAALGNQARDTSIDGMGGAISTGRTGDVLIRNSTFGHNAAYSTNSSGGNGGAAYFGFDTDRVTIEASTFAHNSASGYGGALYTREGEAIIRNSTFADNSAAFGGAMVLKQFGVGVGAATLQFLTMTNNSATSDGGAIFFRQSGASDDTMAITNSAFEGNSAGTAGADSYTKYFTSATATTYVTDSAFATGNGVVGPTITGGADGNIVGDPLLLGALADNGGSTFTRLPADGSPLINAGVPIAGIATDQRGITRTATPTIGSVQIPAPIPPTPPLPVPPSAPVDPTAAAGDSSAVVSWLPPISSGSFRVTTYEVVMNGEESVCLVPVSTDDTQSCSVEDLINGEEYTFTVRALSGAGWSAFSTPSDPVVPRAASIVITGSREGRSVEVAGDAPGLVGEQVTPWIRFPGPHRYEPGAGVQTVSDDGTFMWQRRTGKKTYVYFRADGDVRSNRVIIR